MITLLNLKRQHDNIRAELDAAIAAVIDESAFVGRRFVAEFERDFARYVNASHCIGVGSGTDALRIALEAASITGEVIVPANTAFPTAEAVLQAGATPVFCDCGPDYTMDVAHANSLVTPRTEAVIPVHLYGHPCDMAAVLELASQHKLFVLEDCAHAHGATYNGRKVGTFGHAGAFSFNPVKVLGALGDAGGIVTDDAALAARCRLLADHGRRDKYTHEVVGHNSRLDGLQAAVLSVKLRYLDQWVNRRNAIATYYYLRLQSTEVKMFGYENNLSKRVYACHQFIVRMSDRDRVRLKLKGVGIGTGIHYPLILPEQPALAYLGADINDCPRASRYSREILSLPINESIHDNEVQAVCRALMKILS